MIYKIMKDEVIKMNTNYNRDAFVRSLEKLCLLHREIFSFAEDIAYDVEKAVPEDFDPVMYFRFKPVYTFEAYGNSNEHLNHRYDTNPIFDKNGFLLKATPTGFNSTLSDITEGYELWLLDDMTLAVTYFYDTKVCVGDKFEAVIYRCYLKDGLYKFGYQFYEDEFIAHIEYVIAESLCYNTECNNKCDECEYGEIISEYKSNLDDVADDEDDYDDYGFEESGSECVGHECEDCPYKDSCTL